MRTPTTGVRRLVGGCAVAVVFVSACAGGTSANTKAAGSWSAAPLPGSTKTVFATELACPTTTFCVAVTPTNGIGGDAPPSGARSVWTFDGQHWAGPQELGAIPTDVSCSSASQCLAVTADGGVQFNGTTWTAVASAPADTDIITTRTVSCATPTFCLTATWGVSTVFDGTSWSPSAPWGVNNAAYGLACANPTFCVAVTGSAADPSFLYNGAAWSQVPTPAGVALAGISCPAPGMCVAVGYRSFPSDAPVDGSASAVYRDGSWTLVPISNSGNGLDKISCPTTSFCVAVDGPDPSGNTGHGRLSVFNGTTWTKPVTVEHHGALVSVACPRPGRCTAIDEHGTVYTGTVPTTAAPSGGSSSFGATASSPQP